MMKKIVIIIMKIMTIMKNNENNEIMKENKQIIDNQKIMK